MASENLMWFVAMCVLATTTSISARDAKWFFSKNTVTHFVNARQVTSSCVVLEESLRPCRHLRHITPSPSVIPPRMLMTAAPFPSSGSIMTPLQGSVEAPTPTPAPSRGWGWFQGGEVTVTRTITQRSMPPLVTFSVRGCRPSRLPFDLPLCPTAITTTTTATNNGTTDAQILPTKAVQSVKEISSS